MTTPDADSPRPSTGRRVIFVAAIVVAVAIVVTLVVTGIRSAQNPDAASTSSPTPGPSVSEPAKYSTPPTPAMTTAGPAPTTSTHAAPATKKPVPIAGGTVTPVTGVTAKVSSITAITGKASGVGETSGPALKVVLSVKNGTAKAIDLENAVVSMTYGTAATPADELVSARKALPASAASGATVTATYEFSIATSQRSDVAIALDYGSGAPLVAFTGSAPK